MVDFKLVISNPSNGRTVQKDLKDPQSDFLMGKKIGDKVSGDNLGFSGYEFQVTGGSDFCGFPMRKGVSGKRAKILTRFGLGVRKGMDEGKRVKKTVCGESIHDKIVQVNLKVLKMGSEDMFPEKAPEEKKE